MVKRKKERIERSGGGAFSPLLNLKSKINKIEERKEKLERNYERKLDKAEKKGRDTEKIEEDYSIGKEKLEKEKKETKLSAYSQTVDRLNVGGFIYTKEKILKKPSVQLIQDLNAKKAILRGTGNLALVRPEVSRPDVVPDTRSLFFNDSFVKEKERSNKWLRE